MAPADHPETGTVADDNIRTVARIKEAAALAEELERTLGVDETTSASPPSRGSAER